MNHRHEDFQKRWHYLIQQYQRAKSQNLWCAIYCAIGCLFRPTQKHCVQHRKAAIEIPQKINETLWKSKCHRDGQTALLRCRNESNRQCQKTRNGPVAEQPGGEFTPAVQATREGDAKISPNGNLAEIRLNPRLNSEPFQSATPSLFTHQFQAKPYRCSR